MYGNVAIGMDIMKVNGIPFIVNISTSLDYTASYELKDMSIDTTVINNTNMVNTYKFKGFIIVGMAVGNSFDTLEANTKLLAHNIPLNLTSEDEQKPFSEQLVYLINECCRKFFSLV